MLTSNLSINCEILQDTINIVLNKYRLKPLKVIFLNSVAGKEDATYENHSLYVAMKAASSSLIRTLGVEYPKTKLVFYDLKIPYTQSKMTQGNGESPDKLRSLILDIVNDKPKLDLTHFT